MVHLDYNSEALRIVSLVSPPPLRLKMHAQCMGDVDPVLDHQFPLQSKRSDLEGRQKKWAIESMPLAEIGDIGCKHQSHHGPTLCSQHSKI